MSDLIAARPDDELREMYDEAKGDRDEDTTESELVRELLKTGLRLRGRRLYDQVGLSDRLAGQLEDERLAGESEADVLAAVVEDGLAARRGDVLDAIEASDELRAAVEAAQEEGEPLGDTVRRLLREGVKTSTDRQRTARSRLRNGLAVGSVTGTVAVVYAFFGPVAGGGAILLWASLVAFDDVYLRAVGKIVNTTETADAIRDAIEETREERAEGGTESERET